VLYTVSNGILNPLSTIDKRIIRARYQNDSHYLFTQTEIFRYSTDFTSLLQIWPIPTYTAFIINEDRLIYVAEGEEDYSIKEIFESGEETTLYSESKGLARNLSIYNYDQDGFLIAGNWSALSAPFVRTIYPELQNIFDRVDISVESAKFYEQSIPPEGLEGGALQVWENNRHFVFEIEGTNEGDEVLEDVAFRSSSFFPNANYDDPVFVSIANDEPLLPGENFAINAVWSISKDWGWVDDEVRLFVRGADFKINDNPNSSALAEEIEEPVFNGIDDEQGDVLLSVLPNPATDKVTITGLEMIERITVRDAKGRVEIENKVEDSQFNCDVSDLIPGIYVIEIVTGNKRLTRKIVVQ